MNHTPTLVAAGMPIGDYMLWMLPVAVLVAWLTGRLLGARQRSLLTALAAGALGWLAGCTLALTLVHGNMQAPGLNATMALFDVVFTMAATVGLQLLARPQATSIRALPTGVPHPLRWLRQRAQRLRRSTEITRLAVRHGLGPYLGLGRARQPDGAAVAPERRAHQALEQAGGMFVKLGQMLSTRPDVVPQPWPTSFKGCKSRSPRPTRPPSAP